PIQPSVGRGRLLRRGSRCSGMQQIFGTVERITREPAALGGLGCAISHRRQLRKDTELIVCAYGANDRPETYQKTKRLTAPGSGVVGRVVTGLSFSEGEIAIAKRIEAGREAMIAGLCESPA